MKELLERLAESSKEESEILEKKVMEEGEKYNIFPLSTAQKRLWFLSQFEPSDSAYNISFAIRIEGNLNIDVFRESFIRIIERHEILRTTFHSLNGKPVQLINDEFTFEIPIVDLRCLDKNEFKLKSMIYASDEARKPFDLEDSPLIRVLLIEQSREESIAVITLHHIVSDGWSMGIIIEEFSKLYQSISENKAVELTDLPIQYADYAIWERDNLDDDYFATQLDYWQNKLSGTLPLLKLPIDHPRPLIQSTEGDLYPLVLPKDLTAKLKSLANATDVTLFMLLLASFKALLYRYSNQEDICVGTSIAGRTQSETENLIGFFLNTLVIRSSINGDISFKKFLKQLRQTSLEAFENQTIPIEKLIDNLKVERNTSHNPLFQVLFIFQNTPRTDLKLADLKLQEIHLNTKTSKFDLTLDITEKDNQIKGWIEYNTALFDLETISRLAKHFQNILESIVQDVEQNIAELEILSESEKKEIANFRESKNNINIPDSNLAELLSVQANKTPDLIALKFEDKELTYKQLEEESNRFGNYLINSGIERGEKIGIYIRRSIEQIVTIIGVLKAGAVYVPLESDHPQKRIDYIIDISEIKHIVIDALTNSPTQNEKINFIDLKIIHKEISNQSKQFPSLNILPEDSAYVIYTSGSTGQPKGVVVQHKAIVNYVCFARKYYKINASDKVLQFASFSFDASLEEIFPTLISGATLVLRTEEMISSTRTFFQKCADWGITVLDLPTAYWNEIVSDLEPEQLFLSPKLRLVIIGGEKALFNRVSEWMRYTNGQIELVNSYGPTEATIVSTVEKITKDSVLSELHEITIGNSVANSQALILGENLEVIPIGVIGELHIGGKGLALGYLNQPKLTAEAFIPSPLKNHSGERIYKTGDLARYRRDGRIEFCGRKDDQVKIRGYRIEIGEVTKAILANEEVKEAIVIPENFNNTHRLIAYYTGNEEESISNSDLREFLALAIPEYMIPSRIIKLSEMPLNSNGKIDTNALNTSKVEDDPENTIQPPSTETEETLASIWCEILQIENVGRNQNFFNLGGHSLLGTRVISHIQKHFNISLPLKTLFETANLAGLAKKIDNAKSTQPRINLPEIKKTESEKIRLSFAQERLWFLQLLSPDTTAYNVIRPIRFRGNLNISALEDAFTQLIERHETYQTTFPKIDGIGYIKINKPENIRLDVIDLSGYSEKIKEEKLHKNIEEEGQTPFDVVNGPLWRLKLFKLSEQEHLLLFSEHHLIHDGWTEGLLVNEFLVFYGYIANNQPILLEDIPIQYKDYAVWQRDCFEKGLFDTQIEYWKENLSGQLPDLDLPTDRPRPAIETFDGDTHTRFLSSKLAKELNDYCLKNDVTLYMVLLSVFSTLLYRYSRQEDILIATSIAGRNHIELENLIGFFVNTLLMRNDLSGNPSFNELLNRTKDICFEAYANQDAPFEKVVEAIQPERTLSKQSLFQVMLVLHNADSPDLILPEMEVESLRVHNSTAKFDLLFHIREEEEEGIRLAMEYSTNLFNQSTIDRMLLHFENLIKSVLENDQEDISKLNILTESERNNLLIDWNQTEKKYDSTDSLAKRFEKQVDLTPHNIAIVFGDEFLTYEELDKKANQFANYLKELNVKPEVKVGICLNRSHNMIIVVLGIIKCGGVYVPIDSTYPNQRITYILEDSSVSLLITEKELLSKLPDDLPKHILLDSEKHKISEHSDERLNYSGSSQNLLYITYTSGSTGKPKGIGMPQSSLINLLNWMLENTEIPPNAKTLQFASLSFDVSFQDIFSTLLSGGILQIITEEDRLNIKGLAKFIYEHSVHRIFIPAVALQQLAEGLCEGDTDDAVLSKIIAGSEQLHITPQVLQAFTKLPNAKLHNEYGPSEAHVVTELELTGQPQEWDNRPSVGKPISNICIYILDKHFKPTPTGIPGELYISGPGLARGYITLPKTTAEKFIPDPFSQLPGSRMYQTGDLARFLENGNIEFIGRADHQLKIRGYRIEPGEVEITLTKHPEISDAVVTAYKYDDYDKRLIAYLVTNLEHSPDNSDIRNYLKENLPDYMIPSAFVYLDKIPLNVNGKVDRKNLPAPTYTDGISSKSYLAPQTQLETLIIDIWEQTISVQEVGLNDNFFEIGGHSLLATQMMSQISDIFQMDLPLRMIFENPTVQAFCQQLQSFAPNSDVFEKTSEVYNELSKMSEEEAEEKLK